MFPGLPAEGQSSPEIERERDGQATISHVTRVSVNRLPFSARGCLRYFSIRDSHEAIPSSNEII